MLNTHPFLLKFARLMELSSDERTAIEKVPIRLVGMRPYQDVVRQGDHPSRCTLVVSGLLSTSKLTLSGKRQTASFHIAGDMPDLFGLHLGVVDSDVRAIAPSEVAYIDHVLINDLCERNPRIAAALWKTTLVDAAIFREWCVNLGQRPALKRLSHLFCEMMARMQDAGLAQEGSCALVVTQGDLCEATGLSLVHLNRTLQELRASRLVSFAAGRLTIHDWAALARLAEFKPDYLHFQATRKTTGAPISA